MNRRKFVSITLVAAGAAGLSPVSAAPSRLTTAQQLDLEISAMGTNGVQRLPDLLQRRCMLLAMEGDSRAAATWLERELQRLSPELLDELLVLLVEPAQFDPAQGLLFDPARYPGLQLYRTTAAQWQRLALGPVLPQLFGFADGGRLKARAIGAKSNQAGLAQFHTTLRKESGART